MFEPVRLRVVAAGRDSTAGLPSVATRPAHRSIENLVLLVFWLLLLEGALRKWVAPQYSQFLFFVRDPFVLVIYVLAVRAGALRAAGPLLWAGAAFAVVALLLAFAQAVNFQDPRFFTVAAYGWRQYFLYLPLPFVMAATLDGESLQRFARHAFVAALLTAPLMLLQFTLPPASVTNRGIADDAALQFQSFAFTGGRIRPSGTFTSTPGIAHLIPSTFALLFAVWLAPAKSRTTPAWALPIAAAGVATCLALSGSRAAFVHLGIVVASAMAFGLLARQGAARARAFALPLALVIMVGVLYPLVFPEALAAMLDRVSEAYATESRFSSLGLFGRALYETFDFVRFLQDAPALGYGLGLGGNGRTYLGPGAAAVLGFVESESDWSRHVVDLGPVVGVMFILYRIAFTASLGWSAVRATRRSGSAFPLLLFGYVGIGLFYGQLTGQGTVGGFLWIFMGLCLLSCNTAAAARRA